MSYPLAPALSYSLDSSLDGLVEAELQAWGQESRVARLWKHDASLWTDKDEQSWLGWLGIAQEQLEHSEHLTQLGRDAREAGFTHAVVIGMGGSSLCPEVLALSFPRVDGAPLLKVLDSTDPQQISDLEASLDLSSTLFFVSSKSGSTLEPNIFAAYFYDKVRAVVGDSVGEHFIAITDPGSAVEKLAARDGYQAVFHGRADIGGRYSALSDFGMVPGAAAGVDVIALLQRAQHMAALCAESVAAHDNPGLLLGVVLGLSAKAGHDKVTVLSSPGLLHFGAWMEQLLAESTGKRGLGIVPVDREPLASPERYGSDRLFVYLSLDGDLDSVQEEGVRALEAAGHPVVRILLEDVVDLGGEFFRWEFATAVAGAVIGIDPFDQPDVEAAKIETRKLTEAYEASGSLPVLDWFFADGSIRLTADERNAGELVGSGAESLEGYLRAHLDRISDGDYFAMLAYLPMSAEHRELLTEIRVLVRDALRAATCVGFGPRFQHSTGQAYKGGPNSGVFLQLTCTDGVDLAIPGHTYSFATVKEAQARGDFQALAAGGRRALRVDLGGDAAAGLAVLRDTIRALLS